jgi:hypothetical protein
MEELMIIRRVFFMKWIALMAPAILLMGLGMPLAAGGPKIPLITKKKGSSSGQQTFVGKIKSIDAQKRVLVVTTTEGDQEESFDLKKGVQITSAHKTGQFKISDLSVGMLVTLYIKTSKSASEVYEILMM